MLQFDHGVIGSVGVVVGSLITKILANRQRNIDLKHFEANQIRKELRIDLSNLQEKMERISLDLDQWREKYYRLADENVQMRSRCLRLELELEDLRGRLLNPSNQEVSPLQVNSDIQPQSHHAI